MQLEKPIGPKTTEAAVVEYKRNRNTHFLTLLETKPDNDTLINCLSCTSSKSEKTSCYNSRFPTFQCCAGCDLQLHLLCGPLPIIIKHESHVHPLLLLDYFVEDDRLDFCCHVCELPRDPSLCAYYCPNCPFVAGVDCVISEIIFSLKGMCGNVNLKTLGRKIPSRLVNEGFMVKHMKQNETHPYSNEENMETEFVLFVIDLLMSCSEEEQLEFRSAVTELVDATADTSSETALGRKEYTFEYSDEAFERLQEMLDSLIPDDKYPGLFSEYIKNVQVIDEYLVPESLVPTLNELFDLCKDISARSIVRNPKLKSMLFCMLCCIMEDMRTTKVVDVTEAKLRTWWAFLTSMGHVGFDTQFILQHMKRVVRAHFGLQARNFIDGNTSALEGKIEYCIEEIKKLTAQLEEARKKLSDHKAFVKSATTSLIKECLNDALRLKWKYVAAGLLVVDGGPSQKM